MGALLFDAAIIFIPALGWGASLALLVLLWQDTHGLWRMTAWLWVGFTCILLFDVLTREGYIMPTTGTTLRLVFSRSCFTLAPVSLLTTLWWRSRRTSPEPTLPQ